MERLSSSSALAKSVLCIAILSVVSRLAWTQSFATQVPAVDNAGSTVSILLPIVNTGTGTATGVQVTSITLGQLKPSLPSSLPLLLGDMAAGGVRFVNLAFIDTSLVTGNVYLLTIRGTYVANGTIFGFAVNRFIKFGVPTLFQLPANPLTVTPTLDAAHSVTQTISAANGGQITAKGADGTVFTLTIPPNALLSDEGITMTPVASIPDIPLSGGFGAGVELQPKGLRLFSPGILTIQSAAAAVSSQQWGFSYDASGQDFHLYPLTVQSTVKMQIFHFTGFGWGMAPSLGATVEVAVAIQMEHRLEQQAAELQHQQSIQPDPQYWSKLADLFQEYYHDVVQPLLDAAFGDDTLIDLVIKIVSGWELGLQGFGLTNDPFASEIQSVDAIVQQLIIKGYNDAFQRCIAPDGVQIVETPKMIGARRNLEILGVDAAVALPHFNEQVAACVAGPLQLDLDSTVVDKAAVTVSSGGATVSLSVSAQSHVTAQAVPLQFDVNALHYHGNGPLDYQSFQYSNELTGFTDCSVAVGHSGTVDVIGEFDLNIDGLNLKDANQVVLNLTITPSVSETINGGLFSSDTGCVMTGPVNFTGYDNLLAALHLNAAGGAQASPYFISVNSSKMFNPSITGTTDAFGIGSGTGSASENTTLTLSQTNP